MNKSISDFILLCSRLCFRIGHYLSLVGAEMGLTKAQLDKLKKDNPRLYK